MEAVLLPIIGLLVITTLIVLFYSKKHIINLETKIYSKLLILSFLFISIGLLTFVIAKQTNDFTLIEIFQKIYMSILIILNYYSIDYCLKLFNKQTELKIIYIPLNIVTILSILLTFALPLNVIFYGNVLDGDGLSYNIAIIYCIICFAFFIILTIYLFLKQQRISKILPFLLLVILYIIGFILREKYQELIFEGFFYSYILLIMYFTIENPDMKLLKEIYDSKMISDNANEEKTLFLYNTTQEIRNTVNNIDDKIEIILYSESLEEGKDTARDIREEIAKFKNMTNDILDVSKIDSATIKIYNSKYNPKLLLKTIISNYTDICKEKELEFRTNIEHNIPDMLFGDNISLKTVINLLLEYSVMSTNRGYIELNINTIIKKDICRLIISIEDSSNGIKSTELESIKFENKNISEAYKMITVMNGTMIISSNYGTGNKVKIILDQKIDETNNVEQEYYQIYNNQKILVIDDNESSIKMIEKLLKNTNIIVDKAYNGKDAIKKIKTKNKYDLILLDEELSQISGEDLLKRLKVLRNFDIPIILLSKNNIFEYNNEYKEKGFNDVLIKPLKKEILLEKINKFSKFKA